MDPIDIFYLVTLVVLLFLSAFFSSAETAFTSVSKIRIKSLAEDGSKTAKLVDKILDKKSKMLSAILIGNNMVNIAASALATILAIQISIPVGVMTAILTVLVLILGEIIPKNWAMVTCEKLAFAYSGIIYALMVVLTPAIFIVDLIAKGVLKLLKADEEHHETMTETELKNYVDVSHEDGVIETEEREMILNVFEFSDAEAKDIMIPRVNMVTIKVSDTYDEVHSVFKESMYTRLPVYEEDEETEQDHFIGLLNLKDFVFCENKDEFVVRDFVRECIFTHEHKKTADLLEEMRERACTIAFVMNEYGDTVGMITLEDLLEEIVGEIRDEYDEDEEELISEVAERTYLVDASMNLDNVNDTLNTDIESEAYDSVGGLLIETLDRFPEDGEEVELESGIKLKVVGMDQNRIEQVQITLPEETESEADESEND